ncbi:MAG: GTP 3',8-cyclase MoaA [Candidatus Caldarchaeum sp.]|nr:GTP 3',8-cyclase MoaA [Candidatus Caldarchaeum sp.]MDW8435961.1 GTP 3',8-cyclase MoaA [Candidatus Caldarchaeum sp.]
MAEPLVDGFGRVARKLRLSVTDRCNFRCDFCMPLHPVWMPHSEILTYEEMTRVVRILADMNVTKLRLSGGEPLMRRDIEKGLKLFRSVEKLESISMTTNGYFLAEKAKALKESGLNSVTVSLHSLKQERFEEIVGRKDVFGKVLDGIKTAKAVGLHPVKINCVITRGCNEDEIIDFVELGRQAGLSIRFIEYMPFDGRHPWDSSRLVPGSEIIAKIEEKYRLLKLPREPGSTSVSYEFADGSAGSVSVITSMTQPFCGDCDRIRLTADGKIVPCLFSRDEYDVKKLLRGGASDEEIASFIRDSFRKKFAGVETLLKKKKVEPLVRPMHTIGG